MSLLDYVGKHGKFPRKLEENEGRISFGSAGVGYMMFTADKHGILGGVRVLPNVTYYYTNRNGDDINITPLLEKYGVSLHNLCGYTKEKLVDLYVENSDILNEKIILWGNLRYEEETCIVKKHIIIPGPPFPDPLILGQYTIINNHKFLYKNIDVTEFIETFYMHINHSDDQEKLFDQWLENPDIMLMKILL